jgi:hypothetical protein
MGIPITNENCVTSQGSGSMPHERPLAQPNVEPVPPEISNASGIYLTMGKRVQVLMVFLGLIAFIASLVVATFGDTFTNQWITKSIAFAAALATGVVTLFNLTKKNQEIWAAWRMLNAAILRYQYEPGYTLKQLIDTWEQAEKTLGNATINEK